MARRFTRPLCTISSVDQIGHSGAHRNTKESGRAPPPAARPPAPVPIHPTRPTPQREDFCALAGSLGEDEGGAIQMRERGSLSGPSARPGPSWIS